ncbi:MAG TPA: FAD/NAD(P)-binding protein [Candidatus Dormibacteraeota bacterium]|nr:FAD/NAD(P)-binding protein [Candidatus Dormibacteraeota bacterium]
MSKDRDRELGMFREITRRDFLNGVAVGTGAAAAESWLPGLAWADDGVAPQNKPGYYPPALTGLRGSHPGSFEDAHKLRDGNFWKSTGKPADTGESYDLVIVGGGISGLAAAYFWRMQKPDARILILDNHDDFGGHAKRNEFRPGGRLLLGNGGTWAIESPFPYSKVAHGLMDELGIYPAALAKKCNVPGVYKNLSNGFFFDKETFGRDKLVNGKVGGIFPGEIFSGDANSVEGIPVAPEVARDVRRLETSEEDYFTGLASEQKKEKLSRMSYKNFLLDVVKVDPRVIPIYQTRTHPLFGVGIDAVAALDCWVLQMPGFKGLKLEPGPYHRMGYTPMGYAMPREGYEFHFPDGNATIARLLVRRLIPASIPGNSVEDIVTAQVDYTKLDSTESPVRIRLSSIVVSAKNLGDVNSAREVQIAYLRDRELKTVRAKSAVLACWNMMIPYLCPDLPAAQKDALHYGVKVPLVYTIVAIKNWRSFDKLGIRSVASPGMYHYQMNLDMAVDIGSYNSPKTPDEPILVRMERTPCYPGLSERDQHKIGRGDLLSTSFETFERNIRDQLGRVLGAGGFDPARDIDAITVNRWPHGYAYEYNYLFDPEWPAGQSPCEIARKPFGRIAIANSDAAAAAYTDTAVNEAHRAVQELLRA